MRRRLNEERGATLLIVAAALSACVIIVALVLSTGSWFVKHRHLQLQADAGALAGAASFNSCVSASDTERTNPGSTVNTDIKNIAKQYAGDPAASLPYNKQIADDAVVAVYVNSKNYGSGGADDTQDDPSPGGPPCKSGYVDVKATDSGLSWLFVAGPKRSINTHARVSILQLAKLTGSLPLAVQDTNPRAVAAIFVNEDSTNTVLQTELLTPGSSTTLNGVSVIGWNGAAAQVPISTTHTGVVIALCLNKTLCPNSASSGWLNGSSLSAICGQVFVKCRTNSGTTSTPGLQLVYGYDASAGGSTSAPNVRNVTLTSTGCDDSAPYFLLNGDCNIGGNVEVDFGLTTDPTSAPNATPPGVSAEVFLECNGGNSVCPGSAKSCTLVYQGTAGTVSTWNASNCITIKSGARQAKLDIHVTWTTGTGRSAVSHVLDKLDVARPFANDGVAGAIFNSSLGSYPIAYAELSQGSTCSGGPVHSVAFGTRSICVGLGLIGSLKNASDISDPTKVLKFFQTSSTGAVDCLNGNLEQQIETGCGATVQLNPGEACPNATTPVDCLDTFQGKATGQVKHGMDVRFGCTVNNWIPANVPVGGTLPTIPAGDLRLAPLLVTLFGEFEDSGRHSIPVTDYAEFYVTGWSGSTCAYNEAPPPGADAQSSIWGHFVKYIGSFATSTGGLPCDFSALAPCVTVMTR